MPAEVQDEAEEAPHEGAEDGEEQVWEFTLAHAFKTLGCEEDWYGKFTNVKFFKKRNY